MNIDGTSARAPLRGATPGAPRVDMTVSDAGVTGAAPQPQPQPPPPRAAAARVASSPRLQDVLSAAETQALRDAFGNTAAATRAVDGSAQTGVYAFNGNSQPATAALLGGVLDISG
jgi:hypothetical protein